MSAITLCSALAIKKALDDVILTTFHDRTGIAVNGIHEPTNVLRDEVEAGLRPDVMVAVRGTVHDLAAAGVLDTSSITDLARVGIGLAVGPDAVVPDLSTVEALTTTLCSARSVAYSRTGASGVYFAGLLERLGVAEEVNAKATLVHKGFTALAVADGRADLAVQQLSELAFVPQVRIAGPLPDGAQHFTEFSVALGATAGPGAAALHQFLTSDLARAAYRDAGLES